MLCPCKLYTLDDKLIICFSIVSWDALWLRPQEFMARFGRAGNRVLYVDPIGIRMPTWRDRGRILERLLNRRRAGARGIRLVRPNVWVVDPLINPFQQIDFVHRQNVNALTRQIEQAIAEIGGGKPIIWTYVPTPLGRDVLSRVPHRLVVYDCMDALTENPKGVFGSFAESEKSVSHSADIVFVSSRTLLERQRALNPRTYYVPHGVDYEKFAVVSEPEPEELKTIPHPRLMFFGNIDERLDIKLLERLAIHHPVWQIVLMGLERMDISTLRKYANVHFLGQISHDALSSYLHFGDVFLLPYVQNSYSYYINPAKLHECLAVGKPTVAMSLPVFDEYRDVLRVAATADEYENLVRDALGESMDPDWVERRRARARENTWNARFQEINARLDELTSRDDGAVR